MILNKSCSRTNIVVELISKNFLTEDKPVQINRETGGLQVAPKMK